MAAPLKLFRCLQKLKLVHNLKFVRTCITPPHELYPLKDYHYKKPKAEKLEYIEDPPFATKTWDELQNELNSKNPDSAEPVNIGEPWEGSHKKWRKRLEEAQAEAAKANRQNRDLELATKLFQYEPPLEEIEDIYRFETRATDTVTLAKHYGIFRDLFNDAFFIPGTDVGVFYDDDEDHVIPVLHGNEVCPSQAANPPHIVFTGEEGALYTLMLTNPDGHLLDNNAEYLHWMVSNINNNDIKTGEVLCDYLRPFPPRGTGWHRHVFVLFKQTKKLDLSKEQRSKNCLKERTFKTSEFYREYEDDLIPVGLSFFQAEWDQTVKHTYHHILNMREPSFEYKHPPEYRAPQKKYPHKQPFDRYMDKYRDKRDLAEEAIKERLKILSPFEPLPEIDTYARAYHSGFKHKPTWLQRKEELRHRRVEYFKDIDIET